MTKIYDSIIPLHLYTCWHTKVLPPKMKENYDLLVNSNPEIQFHLYDEKKCRKFIQTHFESTVLDAYDNFIPMAYKSDLWRYCVLYINGGIYLDIKYQCVNGFKLINLTEKEYFVRDYGEKAVYNALIVTYPRNEILLNCINQIVENVKNEDYRNSFHHVTGPTLLGEYFTQSEINNFKLFLHVPNENIRIDQIIYNNKILLQNYNEYRNERNHCDNILSSYDMLWNVKNIYNNDDIFNIKKKKN